MCFWPSVYKKPEQQQPLPSTVTSLSTHTGRYTQRRACTYSRTQHDPTHSVRSNLRYKASSIRTALSWGLHHCLANSQSEHSWDCPLCDPISCKSKGNKKQPHTHTIPVTSQGGIDIILSGIECFYVNPQHCSASLFNATTLHVGVIFILFLLTHIKHISINNPPSLTHMDILLRRAKGLQSEGVMLHNFCLYVHSLYSSLSVGMKRHTVHLGAN